MQLDLEQFHLFVPAGRPNTATFSPDEVHRYTLTRELGGRITLVAMGLNPSTATADEDDQTILKDIGFTTRWGCGRLLKVNAYGYRATDPADMKRARKAGIDVIGPDNDEAIRCALAEVLATGGKLLVAWGNHIEENRQRDLAVIIKMSGVTPMCLGTNKNGTPTHELYKSYETALVQWSCPS